MVKKNWFFSFVRKNEIFYKVFYETLIDNSEIKFESEKEEFENNKKKSTPFRIVLLKKNNSEISIVLSHEKKVIEKIDYIFYLYPYKKNIRFDIMPKIKLKVTKERGTLINNTFSKKYRISLNKETDGINLKIEIKELENPDYLFFSSEIVTNEIVYDFIPWRVIKIEKD
ncbi:MAG: hypothetical protein NC833_05535 [Candidatus Omnitrophica bacterium]|nr:hypothetical protein [Candidatus Omnitrophota bacterium]